MKFRECTPPSLMVQEMKKRGSRSIRMWMLDAGSSLVSVILSEDPSLDDGSFEWHLSVSACEPRGPRFPNKREVRAAMDAAGWLKGSFTTSNGDRHTVHVYKHEPKRADVLAESRGDGNERQG